MPQSTDSAPFLLKDGEERRVTRAKILEAMAEFDRKGLRDRPTIGDNRRGWAIEEQGERYDPKWILKLAADVGLTKFAHKQARETLEALGFKLHFDPDWRSKKLVAPPLPKGDDDPEGEEAEETKETDELTFDLERNLQKALRANIEQLETKLKIIDGGKQQRVDYGDGKWGLIDITAEDENGATVVIELKRSEAGRRAVGQILGYMGCLSKDKKLVRGILVAEGFSPQAIAAASVVHEKLQLRKYSFNFAFKLAGAG